MYVTVGNKFSTSVLVLLITTLSVLISTVVLTVGGPWLRFHANCLARHSFEALSSCSLYLVYALTSVDVLSVAFCITMLFSESLGDNGANGGGSSLSLFAFHCSLSFATLFLFFRCSFFAFLYASMLAYLFFSSIKPSESLSDTSCGGKSMSWLLCGTFGILIVVPLPFSSIPSVNARLTNVVFFLFLGASESELDGDNSGGGPSSILIILSLTTLLSFDVVSTIGLTTNCFTTSIGNGDGSSIDTVLTLLFVIVKLTNFLSKVKLPTANLLFNSPTAGCLTTDLVATTFTPLRLLLLLPLLS